MSVINGSHSEVIDVDTSDAADMFERIVHFHMGITAEAFLQRWDAGEFAGSDWDSVPGLVEVATALPFARPGQ